jgi:hypothetical protein
MWPIYEKLWPLFSPCTDAQGLPLYFSTPYEMVDRFGNHLMMMEGQEPTYFLIRVCPTPLMDLMLLGVAFMVLIVFVTLTVLLAGFMGMLWSSQQKSPPQFMTREIMEELDKAAQEYLRRAK